MASAVTTSMPSRLADWSARRPGDPALRIFQRAIERSTLRTKQHAVRALAGIVKAVDALPRDSDSSSFVTRIDRANAAAEMAFGFRPEIVSLGKQPSGIERDDINVDAAVMDHVQQRLILDAKARREGNPAFHVRCGTAPSRSAGDSDAKRCAVPPPLQQGLWTIAGARSAGAGAAASGRFRCCLPDIAGVKREQKAAAGNPSVQFQNNTAGQAG